VKKHATLSFLLLGLVLLGGPRLNAQAGDDDGCSNATLKGDYAFTISGEILHSDGTIDYRSGIAVRNFDGTATSLSSTSWPLLGRASCLPGAST